MKKHYEIHVLPLFVSELNDILNYISLRLQNPAAAQSLKDAVYDAIVERSACAEAFEPYHSKVKRQYTFYRIYVKNYTVFYTVLGNVMEVQSILYNKRNTSALL